MNTPKHTPGPWAIVKAGEANPKPCGIMSASVRTGMVCHLPPLHGEVEANARLIAAAPELLEALTRALVYVDIMRKQAGGDGDITAAMARAAITKATHP